ncbi:MAG: family 16 glycoside hydrolase [Blastocatellales bacterium]
MKKLIAALSPILCLFLTAIAVNGQGKPSAPDVTRITKGKGWKLVNREATVVEDGGKRAIRFDEKTGQGFAWIEGSDFTNGVIEIDIKGKNVLQRSFVGVAFRGVDEKTHDAVYFRPFNFKSEDPVRRIHAVQYVSHPNWTWNKLRQERNGVYEKAVNPVPDPDGWFHARIVIANRKVSVYVNDAKEPSLVVDELTDRRRGWVGLWVGEGSGGMFANLKIIPAK